MSWTEFVAAQLVSVGPLPARLAGAKVWPGLIPLPTSQSVKLAVLPDKPAGASGWRFSQPP